MKIQNRQFLQLKNQNVTRKNELNNRKMTNQTQLEHVIVTYNEAYRNGNPLVSDTEYDALKEKLERDYPNSTLLKKGVIEQKQKESRKQKLPMYMGSLNKCKSLDEIKQWLKSNNISNDELLVITPKYD